MNIALIYDRLTGGLPIATWTLARALAEEGQRVLVLGPSSTHGHLITNAVKAGVESIQVTRCGLAGIPRSAINHLISFGADVLVSGHRGCDVYTSRLAASLRTPHVCVLHGNPISRKSMQDPSIRFLWLRNMLWRQALRRAARIVCISNYVKEGALLYGIDRSRTRVIYNAIPERNAGRTRAPRNVHRPLRLLAVGRISKEKRPELLVNLLLDLLNRGIPVEGYWIGDGPMKMSLQEQACKAKISRNLHLPGNIYQPDHYYDICDVFVHFCMIEGFGLALIEAQARGLPVVAFRAGAIPEVVEHDRSGVLVEPEDIGAMADAVALIAERPTLYTRFSEGAFHAAGPFVDLSRLAQDYLSLFNTFL